MTKKDIKKDKFAYLEYVSMNSSLTTDNTVLMELLAKDTDNRLTLCKYKELPDDDTRYKRVLDMLENDTLFCAKPKTFNDPFECQIGINNECLFGMMLGTSLAYIKKSTDSLERYIKKSQKPKQITPLGLYLIDTLGNEYVGKFRNKKITDEDKTVFLKKYIRDIMRFLAKNKKISVAEPVYEMLNQIIDEFGVAAINNQIDSGELVDFIIRSKGITIDSDDINRNMVLADIIFPEYKSDVSEYEEKINEAINALKKDVNDRFFIGSLATDPKNRLMWSHYAGSYSGICVEYDFSEYKGLDLFPVYYHDSLPMINSLEKARLMLFNKDMAWEYENEWRIVQTKDKHGKMPNQKYPMPPIKNVYLGINISTEHKKDILKIAGTRHFDVKQMKLDRGKYDIHFETLC